MRVYAISLILVGYITLTLCMPSSAKSSQYDSNENDNEEQRISIRAPKYNFGLGKRRYVIEDVPGAKRLPHYNFGLGKRTKIEPFDYEEDSYNVNSWPLWKDEYDVIRKDDVGLDYDLKKDPSSTAKRASSYSVPTPINHRYSLGKRRAYDFGLGKRLYTNDELEKRLPNRYNFGLGKR